MSSWQIDLLINLAPVIVLLALGVLFGRLAERRHYRSILQREDDLHHVIVISSNSLPPGLPTPRTQLVMGSVVVSVDYFKRFIARLRMLFGGRVHTYESLLDRARREAILRMQQAARDLGAQAVCRVRLETCSISKGGDATIGSVEVLAYGTAVIPD